MIPDSHAILIYMREICPSVSQCLCATHTYHPKVFSRSKRVFSLQKGGEHIINLELTIAKDSSHAIPPTSIAQTKPQNCKKNVGTTSSPTKLAETFVTKVKILNAKLDKWLKTNRQNLEKIKSVGEIQLAHKKLQIAQIMRSTIITPNLEPLQSTWSLGCLDKMEKYTKQFIYLFNAERTWTKSQIYGNKGGVTSTHKNLHFFFYGVKTVDGEFQEWPTKLQPHANKHQIGRGNTTCKITW